MISRRSRLLPLIPLAASLTLLLLAAPASAVRAAEGPGTRAVREANEKIRDLLRKKVEPKSAAEKELAEKVRTELRGFLDVDELGKRALADHWDKLPKAKREEFSRLLRELIEKNYIKGLRANLEYQVKYVSETNKDGDVLVATKIEAKRHGRPYSISIDYILREQNGKLRAFDVVTDGVGLVENYRAQFNKIIEKNGIDGLLSRMRKKRDQL